MRDELSKDALSRPRSLIRSQLINRSHSRSLSFLNRLRNKGALWMGGRGVKEEIQH